MIKKRLATFLSFALFGAPTLASEIFEGSFRATAQYGGAKERHYSFGIEIVSISGSRVEGKIFSPNSTRCPKEDDATGTINGDEITLRAINKAELKGCGRLSFKGTRRGDAFVGTTFFEGKEIEVELKKK